MRLFQDQAHREWKTWHQVCAQLKALGVEINDQNALAEAIKLWGEELVELQLVEQSTTDHHDKELDHLRVKYEPYWIDGV